MLGNGIDGYWSGMVVYLYFIVDGGCWFWNGNLVELLYVVFFIVCILAIVDNDLIYYWIEFNYV